MELSSTNCPKASFFFNFLDFNILIQFSKRTCLVTIARVFHLFPFRTEQLSPSAPMVLGPPGRVGRCQLLYTKVSLLVQWDFFFAIVSAIRYQQSGISYQVSVAVLHLNLNLNLNNGTWSAWESSPCLVGDNRLLYTKVLLIFSLGLFFWGFKVGRYQQSAIIYKPLSTSKLTSTLMSNY